MSRRKRHSLASDAGWFAAGFALEALVQTGLIWPLLRLILAILMWVLSSVLMLVLLLLVFGGVKVLGAAIDGDSEAIWCVAIIGGLLLLSLVGLRRLIRKLLQPAKPKPRVPLDYHGPMRTELDDFLGPMKAEKGWKPEPPLEPEPEPELNHTELKNWRGPMKTAMDDFLGPMKAERGWKG